ncbi:peptidase C14 caspase catalytic subunit p20 [Streptomyces sp. TS71-3]|uniref:peptidase C14 caspase catalytic subunit p20 n=1 Tax=Streptomyces sp. TS71-3 TaxID=2733862 RepID=UPI001BB42E81|nr:peptidase C14 caspase catalytic subunit p20 [Streptomyces sp. TS71-3]
MAVSGYTHPAGGRRLLPDLRNVQEVRRRFADVARMRLGFAESIRVDEEGATRRHLREGLESFLAHGAERKILYWTGHGIDRGRDGYYLACEDTCADGDFAPERAIALTDLVDRLLRPDCETDTLLIVDACFSHGHLPAALERALSVERASVRRARRNRRTGFVVIGTSGIDASVPDGRWVGWLEDVLAAPDFVAADRARPFDPAALYLPVPYLVEAVDAMAAASGLDEPAGRPGHTEVRSLPNSFLDNPHFDDGNRGVHTPAVLRDPKPWLGAEQFGLEDDGHLRRHFAGRQGALGRVVRWMDTHPRGLLAVTGPAGTGKTALLGRLALTSLPEWRDAVSPELLPSTLPRAGTVHAALSCRGQSLHSLTTALWGVLSPLDGTGRRPGGALTPAQCCAAVDELVERVGSLNLLFDALDEAMPEQGHEIARHLLNPLSALWGVRVVVGTRPQPRRRTAVNVLEETLLDTLDQSVAPLVLGDDDEARDSIAAMAASVLAGEGSPYRGEEHLDERDWIAKLVATESHGSFLVARLTARELARRPRAVTETELADWMGSGGMDLSERLAEEVAHLTSQPGAERAEELLRPLAVVQGRGLSRRGPWLVLANALRDEGSPELAAGDLRRVALSAAGGIISAEPAPGSGEAAYHLAHPSYGAYFLRQAGLGVPQAHAKVVAALRARAGDRWALADEYTLHHLGAHAAQVGEEELRTLFDAPEFLLRTSADVMLPLASTLARECDGAALYARVGDAFRDARDLTTRKALLRATAFVSHRERSYRALERIAGFLPWQEYWTDLLPDPVEWRRPAPLGGARTLSWRGGAGAEAEGVSGDTLAAGGRGEVLVLHPESGRRLLTRRAQGADRARGDALTEVREVGTGPHWTTVARDDRALYFWRSDARLPEYVYRWGGAVRTLAAAERGLETVVLAADTRHVWVWRWRRGGRHRGGESLVDIRMSRTERLAALVLGSRLFALAAGERAVLYEVDRGVGRSGGLLFGEADLGRLTAPALAAAAAAEPPGGEPGQAGRRRGWLAVADGSRIWVWRCETDDTAPSAPPVVELALSFDSPARGLAFGRHGGGTLLAAHENLTVRILSLGDPRLEARFRLSAPRDEAMAFKPGGQGVLAVADGPDIRMLEVGSALSSGHGMPRRPHDQKPLVALAAAPEGPPLLCRVWGERVLVSRPDRGAPAGEPATVLTHLAMVTAVRAVHCGDAWIVVAAAGRTVRMWRLSGELEDLDALEAPEAPSKGPRHDLGLGGDDGDRVPSLGLVVDGAAGSVRVYVPDGQRIEHAEMPLDASRAWRRGEPVPAGLRTCAVAAAAMRDGTSWLAADLGDELLLWQHGDAGPEIAARTGLPGRGEDPQASRVALGELYDPDDEESYPLLAWVDGGAVKVAEYAAGTEKRLTLPGEVRDVTSLVFCGAPERPLLLVCDERRSPGVWDVRAESWLHGRGVHPRGYAVRVADAAPDPEGLVVALQGDHRCDLIRLPHAFFGVEARGAG